MRISAFRNSQDNQLKVVGDDERRMLDRKDWELFDEAEVPDEWGLAAGDVQLLGLLRHAWVGGALWAQDNPDKPVNASLAHRS